MGGELGGGGHLVWNDDRAGSEHSAESLGMVAGASFSLEKLKISDFTGMK